MQAQKIDPPVQTPDLQLRMLGMLMEHYPHLTPGDAAHMLVERDILRGKGQDGSNALPFSKPIPAGAD